MAVIRKSQFPFLVVPLCSFSGDGGHLVDLFQYANGVNGSILFDVVQIANLGEVVSNLGRILLVFRLAYS